MNVIWKGPLPSGHYSTGRFGEYVSKVVIHHMSGTAVGSDAWFRNPANNFSAHYGVLQNGQLWQWVSENDTAHHCGNWLINNRSIGIEFENYPDDNFNYGMGAVLLADICRRYMIPIDRVHVFPHREVVSTECPGTLDIDRLINMAKEGDPVTDEEFLEKYARLIQPGLTSTLDDMKAVETNVVVAARQAGANLVAAGEILLKNNLE